MTQKREHNLQGASNLRDLGGLSAFGGKWVRCGQIFRSGELTRLSDSDIAGLCDLNITHVFDLRSNRERSERPSRPWTKEPARWYRNYEHSDANLPTLMAEHDGSSDRLRAVMINLYRELPYHQSESFAAVLHAISESRLPLLFHCAGGKDRTGALAALLLETLGVAHADIEEDYLQSDRFLHRMRERFLKHIDRPDIPTESWDPLLRVEPAYLAAMRDAIEERSGGVHGYLAEIGIGDQQVAKIQNNLLEDYHG